MITWSVIVPLVVLTTRTLVLSFNIEIREPIVKKSKDKNSYFGFSVAQHAVNSNSRSADDYWILVGAPLGRNLQPFTNRSGALYKCPMSRRDNDCEQIETDGKRLNVFDYEDTPSTRNEAVLSPPSNDEIKDNQWLGVTVKSQKPGGKVVVCAHRYIQSPNLTSHHYGYGLCYLLNNELNVEDALEPCKGRPVEKLHQQYGYCQVGTSLAFLSDDFVLMGSPGPYTWRGTIFAKNVVGSFLERDKTVYRGPLNDQDTPIAKYSYLGMSVTGGHFFSKKTLTYVSGASRSNLSGQVFFFNKTKSEEQLNIRLIINGTQFGSSFGYEILAVDFEQDGYDELLVAAPFYYDKDHGGAVYIYNNLRNCTRDKCAPSQIFTGKAESRFGFSMTALGDINKDGFIDVAIGAPYEDNTGAVYIYLGQKGGLRSEPSQIIKFGEREGLKTVGYSLSGGMDMDLNDYPDLLVGLYDSERVILFKTRPIIDIGIRVVGDELRNINASKKGCREDPHSDKTCFSFKTCFKFRKFRLTKDIDIRYEIKELPKKAPRVTIGNDTFVTKMITVTDISREYCTSETAYLIEGNGDILSPISFQVNYTIYKDDVDSPILNKTSIKTFEATFQKNCGPDDICRSKLILNARPLALNETPEGHYLFNLGVEKELILEANVANEGESAYEARLFVIHPESLSYVALQSQNKSGNTICTSNGTTVVICNLGNPFQENQSVSLPLRFEIANTKQSRLELKVFVNSTSEELSKQTSQSFVAILKNIVSLSIKGDSKPVNVLFSGEPKGQSAMRFFEDIGPRITHGYSIINEGKWHIRNMQVEILWPFQVKTDRKEGGKWLLYLEKEPLIDYNTTNFCSVDSRFVNPLKVNVSGMEDPDLDEPEHVRRRRDVATVVQPETRVEEDGKVRKIVTMACHKTAACVKILCTIPQLEGGGQVRIRVYARLWNSTLIEDYSQVDYVTIESQAVVSINEPATILTDNSINSVSVKVVAFPALTLVDKGVNIWIIIGSVIAGLVLLVIVVFALYKCGFFKRNRIKDHTLSGNLKKQGESETLLKDSGSKPAKS
ncbi:integrin alpha-PS1 isoform X2 [Tribolium castaneum]|uniref:Integrin alpha-PS1-like Protein n=1 Tax=Tribolium castaneum TaxID=7070 RepID=A0A139WCN8_TRICA|nr:PREDICTED: integrin alpha-PS1 isoform X2 [Tribolium castaneum]KYB25676.1 Integrin alpha-PS1-like Protein [Tribolium castaneum]|eukprot:XP_008197384.1 PREDICTED: integrin alpha-PS1 isoform X2 [Tribolium castaneum]